MPAPEAALFLTDTLLIQLQLRDQLFKLQACRYLINRSSAHLTMRRVNLNPQQFRSEFLHHLHLSITFQCLLVSERHIIVIDRTTL